MNAHATIQADRAHEEAAELAWARAVLQRQMEVLGELAEVGLQIARATARRAEETAADAALEAAPHAGGDNLAMAYARVARAVRLTLMLQAKVVADLQALDLAERARLDEAAAQADPEYRRKARVERIVERLAQAAHPDEEERVDRLVREAGERLDDEDLYRDILARPMGELVAAICRDLGLDPDWARLAGEPWAQDEIAAGAAGSPFLAPFAVPAGRPPDPEAEVAEPGGGALQSGPCVRRFCSPSTRPSPP